MYVPINLCLGGSLKKYLNCNAFFSVTYALAMAKFTYLVQLNSSSKEISRFFTSNTVLITLLSIINECSWSSFIFRRLQLDLNLRLILNNSFWIIHHSFKITVYVRNGFLYLFIFVWIQLSIISVHVISTPLSTTETTSETNSVKSKRLKTEPSVTPFNISFQQELPLLVITFRYWSLMSKKSESSPDPADINLGIINWRLAQLKALK